MDKEFETRYRRAVKEARLSDATEPRASAARFDVKSRRLLVELRNGSTFMVPVELLEGLANIDSRDLKLVEVTPAGDGLHWERLDVDLSLSGLISGVFGGKRWMAELGRAGGKARSDVKSAAARSNGLKGGRPKRKLA